MDFRISETFTASLARLTGDEKKAVKTTAFDLQLDPSNPGMSFHKLDALKDKRFSSVRVNEDIRLIVHRTPGSLLLCYVDHHDPAYEWARRRKLETHPTTGAAQLVEIRETLREIFVPVYVEAPTAAPVEPLLFVHLSEAELLGFGVPAEWLSDVRQADEAALWRLKEHLPAEAHEALLDLATGGHPAPRPKDEKVSPFEHPDAQRRFRVVGDREELERALEFPWERWTTFLHPAQRELVERSFGGPARVAGTAGTGKTIVALHRSVCLARSHPECRVLLTTFSEPLANSLRAKLNCLISGEPRLAEQIDVDALETVAGRLSRALGRTKIAAPEAVHELLSEDASEIPDQKFSLRFLRSEWDEVIDAWQLTSWEAYRDVVRLGRRTRLPEPQRQAVWNIFERMRSVLRDRGLITKAEAYAQLTAHFADSHRSPYDFVVVDEAQDVSVGQLRFVAALGEGRPDSLFFAGDLGQRIFQLPFSWKALGVDVRGRSTTLKINYRTSHQIRAQADRLLGLEVTDADGNSEERSGAISLFNGAPPEIQTPSSVEDEIGVVGEWLSARLKEGVKPEEIGLFVRTDAEVPRAVSAVEAAGMAFTLLDSGVKTVRGRASVGTMHLSKGLEFRAVAVMACDDEVLPLQSRMEAVADAADLEDIYDTERHLLYVAFTRARDYLLVTGTHPASEFLGDLAV